MSTLNYRKALSPFMVFGFIKSPDSPSLNDKIHGLNTSFRIVPLKDYGYFFFNVPSFSDLAMNEEMVAIKLGQVRSGNEFITTSTILNRGWITPSDANHEDICGNALVLCFSNHKPHFCVYKPLNSIWQLYYFVNEKYIFCTNNLHLMTELMDDPQLNPDAIPMHFLFRSVPGHQTYLKDVYRLCPGEILKWHDETLNIKLCRDYHVFSPEGSYQQVTSTAADHFYEQLKWVVNVYMKELNTNGYSTATMLSGGVDSSLLQLSINNYLNSSRRQPSLTYASDAPSFAPEINYAKLASKLLETDHTFVV